MRVLALDTTTRAGSVALVVDDLIVEERPGDPSRTHAERLPAEVLAVLETRGLALSAIDLFAVVAGPGSFTGLRIGLATVQGLAFVTRRQVVGISALEALAQVASQGVPAGTLVAAWMDAQRREVFSAMYRVTSAAPFDPSRLEELEAAGVGDPASTLARWRDRLGRSTRLGAGEPIVFVGDGAVRYADFVRGDSEGSRRVVVAPPLLAGAIGRMAVARARRGEAVDPARVHPFYVRRPDAVIAREKPRVDKSATTEATEPKDGDHGKP